MHVRVGLWTVDGGLGIKERDFTAFIKPGGFLGRNQTKT